MTTVSTATTPARDQFGQMLAVASGKALAIRQETRLRFVEKNDSIDIIWLSLIAKQHGLFLGPAGEAKSAVVDAIVGRFVDAITMKLLLTRTTTLDEEMGPYDVSQLRNGVYHRLVPGFAPAAHFIFLDEVYKAGSALLNGNLALMNEREYRNDGLLLKAPLVSLFGASNEMPQGDDLDALHDRFLLRTWVDKTTRGGRRQFVADEMARRQARAQGQDVSGKAGTTMTLEELETLQAAALMVDIPSDVRDAYWNIEDSLEAAGYPLPSTRRLGWVWDVVAANAVIHNRTVATFRDLVPLQYALWVERDHIAPVRLTVLKEAAPFLSQARDIYDRLVGDVNEAIQAYGAAVKAGTRETDATVDVKLRKANKAIVKGTKELTEKYYAAKGAGADEEAAEIQVLGRDVRAKQAQVAAIDAGTTPDSPFEPVTA